MRAIHRHRYCVLFMLLGACATVGMVAGGTDVAESLPPAVTSGALSLEELLASRRSLRQFGDRPLTRQQIGQLCWAAQGITDQDRGFRTAPSAGALYPVELYVVTAAGVEHYRPAGHRLEPHITGDVRPQLRRAALDQNPIGEAPACFVITAVVKRTARKYGPRAERYCFMEAGHVAQNVLLQATALGLGSTPIGAFEDNQVAKVLRLPPDRRALYLLPIGHPRG